MLCDVLKWMLVECRIVLRALGKIHRWLLRISICDSFAIEPRTHDIRIWSAVGVWFVQHRDGGIEGYRMTLPSPAPESRFRCLP